MRIAIFVLVGLLGAGSLVSAISGEEQSPAASKPAITVG
jgi:hypothetical protein